MILFQFVGKKRVRNAQNGSRFAQSTVLLDMLVHSNHFIGPYLSPLHRQASGSSYIRLQRAQQLFCGKTGLTVQDAQAALRNHKGYPTSICDHSSEHLPIEIADCSTNFGLVMNLTDNEVWLAPGNPCENPFVKIPL